MFAKWQLVLLSILFYRIPLESLSVSAKEYSAIY
jgi:hypothetical protein